MTANCQQWVSVIGLIFDIIGAVTLSYALIITEEKAIDLGLSYWSSDKREDQRQDPRVIDRLKQSRNAKLGLIFLVTGFILQIIGTLPLR
ncbi:MAG: hypothetical protein HY804_11580 [Nitrospinae bacterium]|nr:hypothetical protein [Nitrospinota bacterium]